ncbi:Conserved_hypothetical protein [Hexamita inflata]|uniref:PI-PLC Y-box domain-containing protein n=1 Tax=Hexamita inflata TaxID=28002 RepID=A0AA86P849_9EUKA|nr:Conserved hypothetical protein [Hexamita inflata]
MLSLIQSYSQNVFSIAEFNFCYNYMYESPFQEHLSFNSSNILKFDGAPTRANCSTYENVIFRQAGNQVVQLNIDLTVDVGHMPFSLFFYAFSQVTIQNSNITMKVINSGQDLSLLFFTDPEFSVELFSCQLQVTTDSNFFQKVSGIGHEFSSQLTLNQTNYSFVSDATIQQFAGICFSCSLLRVENSSFSVTVGTNTSFGLAKNLIQGSLFNISISGSISGLFTYGLFYTVSGSVNVNKLNYSLVTSGLTQNCGLIFQVIGSGQVQNQNTLFFGFAFSPSYLVNQVAGLSCPCVDGGHLNNGLCQCTAGSSLVGNTCVCTAGAVLIGGVCVCTEGATLVNGVCVCTAGAILTGNVCVCTTGAILQGGICVCTVGASLVGNVCVCTPGATLTAGVCVCTAGATLTGGICVCAQYALLIVNICVCQPTFSFLSGSSCACPTHSVINATQCTCAPAHTAMISGVCTCTPQFSALVSGVCTCQPAWSSLVNGICTCSPAGTNMVAGVCTCFAGAQINTGGQCICVEPGSSNSGNSCVCTSDYSWSWVPGGNYWCTNIKKCCTWCVAKIGQIYGCSDNNYHDCTYNSNEALVT